MTYRNFAKYIRKQTGTNQQTFPDPDILLYANIYKDDLSKRIVRTKQDVFGMPMTIDLLLSDDNVTPQREYPLDPNSFQQVKYVEAYLDGNWIPLEEMDLTGYIGVTSEDGITQRFTNVKGNCAYDMYRGSIFIYSGTFGATPGGLKIWTFQWPADFVDLTLDEEISNDPSTISAGFPREFHELLARRIIIARKTESDKPIQLTDNEKKFDSDVATALDEFSDHGPIFAALPEEKQYDHGFNL